MDWDCRRLIECLGTLYRMPDEFLALSARRKEPLLCRSISFRRPKPVFGLSNTVNRNKLEKLKSSAMDIIINEFAGKKSRKAPVKQLTTS
ncbi:hypothetical protein TNCV_2595401 [Trichonephila clavipes]|nr:hypothetical protein TNCV_2595401 [Trichonephila clavipes]